VADVVAALVGFAGVVVGVVLTGGVQSFIRWRDEVNAAKATALILFGDLEMTRQALDYQLALKLDRPISAPRLPVYMDTWMQRCEAFARGTDRRDFHIVAEPTHR
jgi:hypothetical protein